MTEDSTWSGAAPDQRVASVAAVIDERLIGALHLSSGELGDEVEPEAAHAIFQTSTVAALLDGAYEGDVTFGELARHGDLGLGTLNGCDGEMIALEGRFFRADANGDVREVSADEQTPFAVFARFDPAHRFEVGGGGGELDFDGLCAAIDERVGHPEIVHAVRIDGDFERLRLRSGSQAGAALPAVGGCLGRPVRLRLRG